ncbi:XRE family transcriptional regulator [Pontibacter diazotrophicus]|uniref:XRE family transcriptional regulator n=1 Tax=Pontibacter diazotrophicus TaxID=1400979 RepID=A0A3D8LC51_9BACT|nr:helix-turn-helix transcriptional regulator [Pontibacter diazotrophicus]RDV14532.1 XRE family transcriptional regulator [Pontibacter diazotrophicus]
MNLGETIKELRKRKGFNQSEFAAKCNISPTSLSLIESGKKRPHTKTLDAICSALEIPEPFLYFLSTTESDIPEEKREAYKILGPTIKSMMSQLFDLPS